MEQNKVQYFFYITALLQEREKNSAERACLTPFPNQDNPFFQEYLHNNLGGPGGQAAGCTPFFVSNTAVLSISNLLMNAHLPNKITCFHQFLFFSLSRWLDNCNQEIQVQLCTQKNYTMHIFFFSMNEQAWIKAGWNFLFKRRLQ